VKPFENSSFRKKIATFFQQFPMLLLCRIGALHNSYLAHSKDVINISAKTVENPVENSEFLKLSLIITVFLLVCITFVFLLDSFKTYAICKFIFIISEDENNNLIQLFNIIS